MASANDVKKDPAAGSKPTRAGKRPKDVPGSAPTAEDAGETAEQTQARESEGAFDRALGRIPPG
jgi:hypothetical protein